MQLPYEEGVQHPQVEPLLQYIPRLALPLWDVLDSNRRYVADPVMLKRWRTAIQGRSQALGRVTGILHEEGAPLLAGPTRRCALCCRDTRCTKNQSICWQSA